MKSGERWMGRASVEREEIRRWRRPLRKENDVCDASPARAEEANLSPGVNTWRASVLITRLQSPICRAAASETRERHGSKDWTERFAFYVNDVKFQRGVSNGRYLERLTLEYLGTSFPFREYRARINTGIAVDGPCILVDVLLLDYVM